jgi:uncharacterized YigZ family protein
MTGYRIPAKQTRTEIMVVNSRFIATAAPVFSVEEARTFIQDMRREFSDATHNVPAFLIGHGQSVIAHSSDDGEPSGTAGRPALTVLQGSGLGDIAVVVTRYFGGTKLGTGGLVRAYTDAVKEVLNILPLAEKVPTLTAMLAIPYSLYEQAKLIIQEFNGKIIDEEFTADVTISIQFIEEDFEPFNKHIIELSRGKISAEVIEKNPATIMPISEYSR